MPATTPTREKKRKHNNTNDDKEPERRRLQDAHHNASSHWQFLPHADSPGVGKFGLTADVDKAMHELFHAIVKRIGVEGGVTWGEGQHDKDPRRRMYGFMPGQRQALVEAGIKIQKEGALGDQEHEYTLQKASVDLVFCSQKETGQDDDSKQDTEKEEDDSLILSLTVYDALVAITKRVQDLVPESYKQFVTIDQLIATQPNLHNGASYLPAHLDFPRFDGFGVVICTVAIQGTGDIILIDDGDEDDTDNGAVSYSFPLNGKECYFLCGDARNKCVHGVLCSSTAESICRRETLNLRFGLHSAEFAKTEVDQHWPE